MKLSKFQQKLFRLSASNWRILSFTWLTDITVKKNYDKRRETPSKIHQDYGLKWYRQQRKPETGCHRCGNRANHPRHTCPVILTACHNSKVVGHYAQCCRSKKVYKLQYDDEYSYSSDDNTTLCLLTVAEIKHSKPWRIELAIHNMPVEFKIDSRAIAENIYRIID